MLRRVRAHPPRRQDGPARHPRHGRGRALLRPRDAARARPRRRRSATRSASASRYLELNFSERGARARRPPRADRGSRREESTTPDRCGRRPRRDRRRLVRGRRRRARRGAAARRARGASPCASRFHADVDDPLFGLELAEQPTRPAMLAASTGCDDPHPGAFRAGEEVVVRVSFDNVLGARPLPRDAGRRARRAGEAWLDRRERMRRVVVTARAPPARWSTCPYDDRRRALRRARRGAGVSAVADDPRLGRRGQGPDARSATTRGASWRLDVDARGHRLQAALLRLGAGLPVAAHAAADALRRPLRRLHAVVLDVGDERPVLPPSRCCSGIVLFTFLSEATSAAVRSLVEPREPGAQGRLPAPGRAAGRRCSPRCSTSG